MNNIAGVVTLLLREYVDSGVIFAVVVLNAVKKDRVGKGTIKREISCSNISGSSRRR
jgi:hypothetical protein